MLELAHLLFRAGRPEVVMTPVIKVASHRGPRPDAMLRGDGLDHEEQDILRMLAEVTGGT
jgi:hypothetical protein